MKTEYTLFGAGAFFFAPIAVVYGIATSWHEPVGAVALFLTAGLALLIGLFFWITSRRIDPRPEDDRFLVVFFAVLVGLGPLASGGLQLPIARVQRGRAVIRIFELELLGGPHERGLDPASRARRIRARRRNTSDGAVPRLRGLHVERLRHLVEQIPDLLSGRLLSVDLDTVIQSGRSDRRRHGLPDPIILRVVEHGVHGDGGPRRVDVDRCHAGQLHARVPEQGVAADSLPRGPGDLPGFVGERDLVIVGLREDGLQGPRERSLATLRGRVDARAVAGVVVGRRPLFSGPLSGRRGFL